MAEAMWLDSVVRPYLPAWLKSQVEKRSGTRLGRALHFLVDYFILGKWLGLKITRGQDTEVLGGNGFRPGINHGYRIKQVRVTVEMRGKEVAKKTFPLNLVIKNNQ